MDLMSIYIFIKNNGITLYDLHKTMSDTRRAFEVIVKLLD